MCKSVRSKFSRLEIAPNCTRTGDGAAASAAPGQTEQVASSSRRQAQQGEGGADQSPLVGDLGALMGALLGRSWDALGALLGALGRSCVSCECFVLSFYSIIIIANTF